jgi:hypothetical protein
MAILLPAAFVKPIVEIIRYIAMRMPPRFLIQTLDIYVKYRPAYSFDISKSYIGNDAIRGFLTHFFEGKL